MQDIFLIIVIPLFFKTRRIKQKIIDIYGQDAVFIVMRRNDIFGNNDFLERIVNLPVSICQSKRNILPKTRKNLKFFRVYSLVLL